MPLDDRDESSTESTPLLAGQKTSQQPVKRTPLPLRQLAIIACIRLVEPISFTLIFPFVNQMMEDIHVTPKLSEIGFYSGLVDSIFAFVQFFTIFHWGRLSDRIGRRPVIFIGLTGSMMSITLFGLSRSLIWALLARSVAGALSGNIAVIQSMLGEITDKTNEAQAMPLTSITWSLGCIIGPLIGGSLARPAHQWPDSYFGHHQFFKDFPYFLPCATAASMTSCALAFGYFRLNETLPSKVKKDPEPLPQTPVVQPMNPSIRAISRIHFDNRHRTESSCSSSSSVTLVSPPPEEDDPLKPAKTLPVTNGPSSAWSILIHKPLRRVMVSGFILSVLATAYDVIFTLVCYTPIHLGGLSLQPIHIGWALAFGGAFSVFMLPFGFPPIQRRVGTSRMYRWLMALWPLVYAALPLLNITARIFLDTSAPEGVERLTSSGNWILALGVGTVTILARLANMMFSLNMMLVKFAAPNKDSLGSTFGVSQTVACVARAMAPAFVSSLFAISTEHQLLQGNAVWLVMCMIGFGGIFASQQIPETDSN